MPYLEYILLALIGSTGPIASIPATSGPELRTLGADAIVQPAGSVGFNNSATAAANGNVKPAVKSRRQHPRHRRAKHHGGAPKPDALVVKQKLKSK
jgi:hypothetical protein